MKLDRTTLLPGLLSGLFVVVLSANFGCEAAKVNTSAARGPGSSTPGGSGSAGANGQGGGDPSGSPGNSGPGINLPAGTGADASMSPVGGSKPPGPGEGCAADVHSAEVAPLDLLLLVDSSGSMREKAGVASKWDMAKGALAAFVKDPKSAGLGAGLQFFPFVPRPKACTSDADCGRPPASRPNFWCHVSSACVGPNAPFTSLSRSCDPGLSLCSQGTTCVPVGQCKVTGGDCVPVGMPCSGGVPGDTCMAEPQTCNSAFSDPPGSCTALDYEAPIVPIADLPMAQVALIATLDHKYPTGGTPMGPAVTGSLAHLRKHATAHPGRRAVLVLATDGLPQSCEPGNDIPTVVAALAAGQAMAPAISTYVIGVFDPAALAGSPDALNMLATAGGTGKPFVLTPGDDLTQKFIESLNQIRGAALACEFKIPAAMGGGQIDHGKVNVRITSPAGNDDLIYVARADRCDPTRGGWYYDVEPGMGTPTRVLTCPASCTRLKDAKDAKDIKVELLFGCQSRVD